MVGRVQLACNTCSVDLSLPAHDPQALAAALDGFFAAHEACRTTLDLGGAALPTASAPEPEPATRRFRPLPRRREPTAPAHLEVRLLGGLSVRSGGAPVDLPEEQRLVLALLAVRGGFAPVRQLELAGADREGTVLAQLEQAGLVVRPAGDVALPPGTRTDVGELLEDVHLALSDGDGARAAAWQVVDAYAGGLLPDHRHLDWTTTPRERLRGRYLEVLDRLAAFAAAEGDVDAALAWYDRALAADPYGQHRYLAAAELLLAHGRPAAATAIAGRALEQPGVTPSAELSALARRVRA